MSNKVTYTEIVEALASKTGFSKNKSEAFIKGIIGLVKQDLEANSKAVITNFGSFTVKEVAERQGQNPQTGEPITIPAHNRVNFSPYKPLRESVNAPYAHLETELLEEEAQTEKPAPEASKTAGKPASSSPREKEGSNTGLMIAALLLLVIIALASGWFLMTSDDDTQVAEEAAIENPQTPEAAETMDEVATEQPQESAPEEIEQPQNQTQNQAGEQADSLPENPETVDQTEETTIETVDSYQVQSGEWYWVIAEKVYGESGFWPLLFQANETLNDDPDQLYPSTGLEVPELEGTVESPSSGDYRRLAVASVLVSEAYDRAGKNGKAQEYARFAEKWERLSAQRE